MQFTAALIALFATSALAQYPGRDGWWGNRPIDGNQEGPYQAICGCTRDGQFDHGLGRIACEDLRAQYPNIQYDQYGGGCIDRDGRGIEAAGMRRACQRQAGEYAVVDSTCGN